MAYVGLTNVTIAQGGAADFLYATYAALTSGSWDCLGSGLGAAGGYSSSGSLVTSAASFNSNNSWVRMREPGGAGGREYIFQRSTAATTAVVKYSRADGFTGGSPAAAVSPTSTDTRIIVGGGTDASPTGVSICGGTGYIQAIASNTAVNGAYGFWTFQYAATTGILGGIMMTEGISPGSTPASDADPSWRMHSTNGTSWWSGSPGGTVLSWWQGYNLAGEVYITGASFGYPGFTGNNMATMSQMWPTAGAPFGLDPYDGKSSFFPLYVGKPATYPKGYTSGVSWGTTAQNQLDVFNIATAEPRIAVATNNTNLTSMPLIVIPWVPNIVPVV